MSLEGFVDFVKQEYDCDISLDKYSEKDTFEKIFGAEVVSELNEEVDNANRIL